MFAKDFAICVVEDVSIRLDILTLVFLQCGSILHLSESVC